jgi:hypothetical protein
VNQFTNQTLIAHATIGMLLDGRPLKAGTKIPKGSTITLMVGEGLANTSIPVPYLIGLRYQEVVVKLIGIQPEHRREPWPDGTTEADKARAFVYKQSPGYGSGRIHLGEEVHRGWPKKCRKT